MNTAVVFPAPAPELKLPRPSTDKWAATLVEERRRLQEDQEALRERETNLREYEERLRAWQAQLDAGRNATIPPTPLPPRNSLHPFTAPVLPLTVADDPALQLAWEKLHRARELLEAEQNHLRDDRMMVRDMEAVLKKREDALAQREAYLAERERLIVAASPSSSAPFALAADNAANASKLSRTPFELARVVFGKK